MKGTNDFSCLLEHTRRKRPRDDSRRRIITCFSKTGAQRLPISSRMLQEKKTKEITVQTGILVSNGCLESFPKRHNDVFKVICGEFADSDKNVAAE